MASPAIILAMVFFFLPLAWAAYSAFCTFDVRMHATWVGWPNIVAAMTSPGTLRAASNTLLLAGGTLVSVVTTGFVGGLALGNMKSGTRIRSLFQVSVMFATSANGMFWMWLFMPFWGGMAQLAKTLGRPGLLWYSTPALAQLACLIVLWAWNFPGVVYFVSVAASGVPKELLEAAQLDGANAWQSFRHVTLPVIRKPLAYMAVSNIAGLLQVYEVPYMLWRGGPLGATQTVVMRMAAMEGGYGQAAALSLVMIVVISAISWMAWKLARG
jgi:multiple sugar transport system permease protein